jgi:hypothetical protein
MIQTIGVCQKFSFHQESGSTMKPEYQPDFFSSFTHALPVFERRSPDEGSSVILLES